MRFPLAFAGLALIVAASSAVAQPLGSFRWQLLPYCNVVTLAVTQNGAVFTLDGADNQCGAGPAASVLGTAFFDPDGSVGMGLHLVVTPGAAPVHVTATLNPATLSGTWADSAGHSGVLAFGPSSPAPGPPRPAGGGLSGVAVTTVTAGPGLTGSSGPGAVNLAVAFGGTGAATTAARSDHTNAVGAPGAANTGVGVDALPSPIGGSNTAIGRQSLFSNTTGVGNTAIGNNSLRNNTSGHSNIAIGSSAGLRLTMGSNNIHIGSQGIPTEDNTIRIGVTSLFGTPHTRAFLAGVRGVTTGSNNAVAVLIDSAGQLGTVSSTRRVKEGIVDLGGPGFAVQRLRPVQFQYRQPFADGTKPVQYGLIAEEVAEVLPELVAHDDAGQPATVKYHVLPTLLVAEVQRLERERLSLEAVLRGRDREIAVLEQRLAAVERLLTTREKR